MTAPKGRRGTLSYIDFVDVEAKTSHPTTEFEATIGAGSSETYNQTSGFTSDINDASREFPGGNSREISGFSFPGMVFLFPGISGKGLLLLFGQNHEKLCLKNDKL